MATIHPVPAPKQMPEGHFAFFCPANCFEDLAKSEQGKQMRIGGLGTTAARDLQGEDILQKGINWDDALGVQGFFNYDHKAGYLNLLGAPESVQLYAAGSRLPDGREAQHDSTWIEGYLFDTKNGRDTWELARAMQGSGRQLGFSVEGQVEERTGPTGSTIAKARIQHIAITHQPVNPECRLEVLLRSITAINKGLAVGQGVGPQSDPAAQSGRALTREKLDERIANLAGSGPSLSYHDIRKKGVGARDRGGPWAPRRKVATKSLSDAELFTSIYTQLPHVSADYAVVLSNVLRQQRTNRS